MIFDRWSVSIFEFKIKIYEHLFSKKFKISGLGEMGFLYIVLSKVDYSEFGQSIQNKK